PLIVRGKKLGFVSLIINKRKTCVQLQSSDFDLEIDKWRFTFMFDVIGIKPRSNAVRKFAHLQWGELATTDIFLHDDGFFLIKFHGNVICIKVASDRPYFFNRKPIVLKPWSVNNDVQSEVLKVVPEMVRFPSLPLYHWADNLLRRIGSALRVPICAYEYMSQQTRVSYGRMLIEVDITNPRAKTITVAGVDEVEFEQQVAKCNRVSHNFDNKTRATKEKKN
ncbi:Cell division protein FtsZ, partial [Bienertia sinuspersici]